ncbi:MAG: MFS transporter, partial [Selenomonadaceae bacterium]
MLIEIKNWKITLAILCANVIMMASGYNMLIPFLPMYLITELGVPADDASLWTGLVFSVTFLLGGIMAPIWGKMADKHGKKLMALRSSIMLCISYYAMAVVQTPEQLFMARAFQGFAAGLLSVFMAICSASVPKDKLG